jgi:hypothetical protein
MTRFLQAAFPNAYFIVIRRHPVPVSMATQRWKVSLTSLHSQFEHWLRCYGIFEEDKKYLKHVYELAYEDYTINPAKYHQEIAAFIGTRIPEATGDASFRYVAQWRNPMGLRVPEGTMEEVTGAYNKKYFDRWSNLLNNSPFKNYYRYVARKYESRFAKYGYSLTRESDTAEEARRHEGRAPAAIGTLYCIGADVGCLIVRCARWSIWRIKKGLRAALPKPLRIRIKHVLQKVSVGKGRTDAVSS